MKEKLFTTNAIYHADLIKKFLEDLEDTQENRLALAVIASHLNASMQAIDNALYGKWNKSIKQCKIEQENSEDKQSKRKRNKTEYDLFSSHSRK